MAKSSKKGKKGDSSIVVNKKARHDYHIDETFEAGISLAGWEVKSLRQGKVQLVDSYVLLKDGEAWLIMWWRTHCATASCCLTAGNWPTCSQRPSKKAMPALPPNCTGKAT